MNKDSAAVAVLCCLLLVLLTIPLASMSYADTEPCQDSSRVLSELTANYSTYFGGESIDELPAIVLDHDGNLILAGQTLSSDLPTTSGVFQEERGGSRDGFIAKLDPEGQMVFCTYLGGSSRDQLEDVAIDSNNNIIVVGATESDDFPVKNPYQENYTDNKEGFITKLSNDGTSLIFSTYLGDSLHDWLFAVEVDSEDNIIFGGWTANDGLATPESFQDERSGGRDMIIGKFAEDGSDLLWVTYYGDSINDFCFCLDVDSEDNIIVGGVTNSPNITLVKPIQDEFGGGFHDMMVAKINPEGTGLVFSTFYGGNRTDWMLTLRLDSHDNIWFGGYTDSSDYPVKNAYQGTFNGGSDCVVTQVSASGVLTASTFIGMVGTEQAYGIGFDSHGNAIVVGRTSSDDFPVHEGALQGNLSGSTDAFVLNMTQDFQSIPRCTLFGGSSTEMGEAIEVTKEGTIIIAGTTDSDDLVTSTGVLRENYGGSRDIFILWNPLGCPYESNSTDHPSTVDTSPLGLGAVIGCAVLVTGVVLLAVRRRR